MLLGKKVSTGNFTMARASVCRKQRSDQYVLELQNASSYSMPPSVLGEIALWSRSSTSRSFSRTSSKPALTAPSSCDPDSAPPSSILSQVAPPLHFR